MSTDRTRDEDAWAIAGITELQRMRLAQHGYRIMPVASQPEPAVTEALRPWMDRDGGIHVDDPEDVPAFLEAVRATLATVPAPSPAPHEHQWRKEYAPGYRPASEADDFRWVCNCGETHGMQWSPPSPAPAAEPSSKAGMVLLMAYPDIHGRVALRDMILAIEEEARASAPDWVAAATRGYQQGVKDAEARAASPSPAVAPLDSRRFGRAVRDAGVGWLLGDIRKVLAAYVEASVQEETNA